MIEPTRPARRVLPVVLLALALVAACGGTPAPSPSPSGAAVAPTPAPATPTPAPATPTAAPSPTAAPIPTACVTLGDIDCQRAAGLARQVLLPTDPQVVYVQAGPFGCRDAVERCPTTLVARPEGDVTFEFADGTALMVHLIDQNGSVSTTRGEAFGVLVEPASEPGLPAGPQPFTLGHCGVFSGIDIDGSWWDPVGPVDLDSGEGINATPGTFSLTDPDHATFSTPAGFSLQLQRRTGAKWLPMCM